MAEQGGQAVHVTAAREVVLHVHIDVTGDRLGIDRGVVGPARVVHTVYRAADEVQPTLVPEDHPAALDGRPGIGQRQRCARPGQPVVLVD
jgi:hypothetical protein